MKVEFDKSFYKSFDKNANSVLAKKLKRVIEDIEQTERVNDIGSIKKLEG